MILLHERMGDEAEYLKALIGKVFNIPVRLLESDLDQLFVPIPNFEGYYCKPRTDFLMQKFPNTTVLILTTRDLYGGDKSKDDEWILGANFGLVSVIATARIMGPDNKPRSSLAVDSNLYLQRLSLITIHELGHHLIKAPHYQSAFWVNIRDNTWMPLGPHCDDNSCAMYEVVDIIAPPKDEGHLQLGNTCLYDAGIDEHLGRLREDWFCSRCKGHIMITEQYRNV